MTQEQLLAAIENEEDLLTPKFQRTFAAAADSSCPKCGDRMEVVSNGDKLFSTAVALAYSQRCVRCGAEVTDSGILL